MEAEVNDLRQQLYALMQETFDILNKKDKKSFRANLKLLLSSFSSTRIYEHLKIIYESIFDNESDISEILWAKVEKYCHLLYYDLLVFIICKIGTRSLKQKLNDFITAMKKFVLTVKLSDDLFSRLHSSTTNLGVTGSSDSPKIVVEVINKSNELQLAHLYHLTRTLISMFSMPFIVGPLLAISDRGCTMTWSIPSSCVSLLRWKITSTQPKFFMDRIMHSIHVDGMLCYLSKADVDKFNPAREIASVTSVSAESFELVGLMKVAYISSPPVTLTQLCTAYTCELLTKYLSYHPTFGARNLQIHSLISLPFTILMQLFYLCKLAYEGTLEQLNATNLVYLPLRINGLGLTNASSQAQENIQCFQTILHPILQQYLVAFYIHLESMRSYSHVKFLNLGYIPYFCSGLKQDLLVLPGTNVSLMLFELGTPHAVEKYFNRMRITGQVIPLMTNERLMQVISDLINPEIIGAIDTQTASKNCFSQSQTISLDDSDLDLSISEVPQVFSSYIAGRLLSYSNCKWKLCGCLTRGFVQGLIASTESSSNPSNRSHLEVHIEVMSESDLEMSSRLPFCVLRRTKHIEILNLSLSVISIQALESLSFLSGDSIMQLSLIKCIVDEPSLSKSLHEAIKSLHFLKGLVIKTSFLTNGIGTALCLLLKHSKCLTLLQMDRNNLSEGDTLSVISGISESESLMEFKITELLSETSVHCLSAVLAMDTCKITVTDISWCGLTSNSAFHLKFCLSVSNSLQLLDMDGNYLGPHGASSLSKGLKLNNSLKVLKLSLNDIEDEGACQLAEVISTNRSLEKLFLAENCIGPKGIAALAQKIIGNTSVKVLDLSRNRTGDGGACALADMLQRNRSLEELDIERNCIGHEGTSGLARALEVNTTLKVLNLNGNNIQSKGAEALAGMILKNRSLHTLKVENNLIDSYGATQLRDAFWQTLRVVQLHHNLEV